MNDLRCTFASTVACSFLPNSHSAEVGPAMSIGLLLALVGGGYAASRILGKRGGAAAFKAARSVAREQNASKWGRGGTGVSPFVAARLPYLEHEHAFLPSITRREALLILGFQEEASPTRQDIEKRFRRLMALHHEDVGGSPLVARKIIEAKEELTK